MTTDEERGRPRDRLRFRCGSCQNQVAADIPACPHCGAPRPARGWVRVTELVVHDRFEESPEALPTISGTPPILSGTPARPPVHRTVYLEAPGASSWFDPEANHTVGLAMTFLGTFLLTTFLVLAVFYAVRAEEPAPGLEPVADGEVLPVLPAAAPIEPSPTAAGDASAAAATPRSVPEAAARMAGEYTGTIDGSPVTFVFSFSAEGRLAATITPRDGVETLATGAYQLDGEVVRIDLEDQGAMTVSAYRGKISGQSVSGQITSSSGDIRYFSASR